MARALLLVNPRSRSGARALGQAEALLQRAGFAVDALDGPADALAAEARRRRRSREYDVVVAGGGDGTLGSIAGALLDGGPPLGVLPLGTANDFARTLGLPTDPAEAVGLITRTRPRPVDVGLVNGIPFLNAASLGLSADLAGELTDEAKRRFGRFGYLLTALRLILEARSFRVTIEGDCGRAETRSLMIAVGNGRHHGGGLTIAPDARIDDGMLDLYSLETTRLWRLALIGWALRSGHHVHWSDVRAVRGERFEIRTRRPRPVNVDGELRTMTPARFSLRRGALMVHAPASRPGLQPLSVSSP